MNKLSLAVLIALACTTAQAQRDYPDRRSARDERRVDACVDDSTRGERMSRKQLKRIEEQCRRGAVRSQEYSRDRSDAYDRERPSERRRSTAMPDGSLQGRNLRGVPDTSGPP